MKSKASKRKANNNTELLGLKQQGRYGDVLSLIFGQVAGAAYLMETYTVLKNPGEDESTKHKAMQFLFLWYLPSPFYLAAVLKNNLWCSRIALLGVVGMMAHAELAQYPSPGECDIVPALSNMVVMGVLANISLGFGEKMARLVLLFVVGSYVSIKNPYSSYVDHVLPLLGGVILLAAFGLYVYHCGIAREYATVQAARLVLASIFVYHTITNMPDMGSSAGTQVHAWLRSIILASIGAVATGTFRQEVLLNERLEQLVKQRTKKLYMVSMALQASETAIVITDQSGAMVWLNRAFCELCGKPAEYLLGKLVKNAIYNCDPSRKENKFAVMESYEDNDENHHDGNVREAEIVIGDSIYLHESTPFPEHDDHNDGTRDGDNSEPLLPQNKKENKKKNNRFLMVFKDITASRAREVAEQKAQDKAMMAKAMGDSMVTLTHELRTPLQGIMGVTSMLMQSNELSMDAIESMKLIMASSTLLLNLINNLLDVKKATAKMMEEFPLSPVSAVGPIEDAIVFSKPLASISDVEVSSDVTLAPNAFVMSNSLRLQQVLINLVSNAIKYTTKGSTITVTTHESTLQEVHAKIDGALASSREDDGGMAQPQNRDNQQAARVLVFSVADRGPGIEKHQADRLFQRYAQLDNQASRNSSSKDKTIGQPSGTGLGLHLCQMFVQRMKGHIWVTNNHNNNNNIGNQGSTFSFALPLFSNEMPSSGNGLSSHSMDAADTITIQGNQKRRRSSVRRSSSGAGHLLSALSRKDVSSLLMIADDDDDDMDLVYNQRLLFVDDTLINRKVISRILAKVGFKNVTTVESGEAAMEELLGAEKNYDLVISDLQMPGMSGTELSEAIAEAAASSGTNDNSSFRWPVVIGLTADTGLDVAERCRASKMSDVLYKPITIGEVKRYAENVLLSLEPGVWYDGNTLEEEGLRFGSRSSLPVQ